MSISIIIPYHNEGSDFLKATIKSIEETIDIDNEIIIVDDCSDVPLKLNGVHIIRQLRNKGVGVAFDTGISAARNENIFLMGCDVRFVQKDWASLIEKEIEANPLALTCTSTIAINSEEMEITGGNYIAAMLRERLRFRYNGAKINIIGNQSILDAQWLDREIYSIINPQPSKNFDEYMFANYGVIINRNASYEIPCILGAAYGVSKKWYKHIDGFWGHKHWGTLEPYISLKSWLFGGSCRTAPHIETGHIFKPTGTHGTGFDSIMYNKILVSLLLFDNPKELIDQLPQKEYVDTAKQMIRNNFKEINEKKAEYKSKMVISIEDYKNRFNAN